MRSRLEPQGGIPVTWLRIQLDNTAPRRKPASTPYDPPAVTCDVQVTSPDTLGPPEPAMPVASTSDTNPFAAGGSPWTLNLAGMQRFGYVIRLEVSNRSIINSQPGTHNSNYSDVGFCIS